MEKCEGLMLIRRLLQHEPGFVASAISEVVRAVLGEVKNLRSSVVRQALLTCGDLCRVVGKPAEKYAEDIVTTILVKAGGEASGFIKDDAETAMMEVVDSLSPFKVISALLPHTAHKNREVRRMAGKMLVPSLGRAGPKMLSHREAPVLLRSMAKLVSDGDQETRYFGRVLANELMQFGDHEAAIQRHLDARQQRDLLGAIETVRKKGVGAPPLAATHRGPAGASAVGSRTARAKSRTRRRTGSSSTVASDQDASMVAADQGHGGLLSPDHRDNQQQQQQQQQQRMSGTSPNRRGGARTGGRTGARAKSSAVRNAVPFKTADGDDLLKVVGSDLKSSDWKTREKAIGKLLELVLDSPDKFVGPVTNVFFDFAPRLQDSNSKVNVAALKALVQMLPLLPDALEMVMAELLSSLTLGLASKNASIHSLAESAMAALVSSTNPAHVAQPYMTQMKNANSVIKEAMATHLVQFVPLAADVSPKLLQKHVVGTCVKLLPDNKLHAKLAPVWKALYGVLGESLFKGKAFTDSVTAQVRRIIS